MGLDRCLTEKNGVFTSQAHLEGSGPLLESIVAIQGVGTLQFYSVDATDLGGGIVCANGRYANPIGGSSGSVPVSGTVTLSKNKSYFLTANSATVLPNVTGFTGGETVTISAAIAAVASTLTVNGSQGELIKTSSGGSDTVFNLTSTGVSFEFIFNAVTGNWEV